MECHRWSATASSSTMLEENDMSLCAAVASARSLIFRLKLSKNGEASPGPRKSAVTPGWFRPLRYI
jgi:hypothetical protein|eukprot:3977248-Prymnesium_polylepis.1